ncbi:MAG: asparaginase, partial [Burkholderiaceae bacterium]
NYAGASARTVDELLLANATSDDPLRGIVVAGTGNGTLHMDLLSALLRAQRAGVRVVRATRCATGRVLAHASDQLPDSDGLSAVKARIALMLELMQPELAKE